jgi:protein-tyrosine-phosphatase
MAEALMQSKLMRDYPDLATIVNVHSAGTSAIEGNPATTTAVQAMDLWGIDLEPHRATELTRSQLRESDLVLAMSRDHLLSITRLEPEAMSKSTTLKHIASLSHEITERLGEDTVRDEGEARARIDGVLELLRKQATVDGFVADIQSRGSDIIDPIGSSLRVYLGVAEDIDSALDEAIFAIFGHVETEPGNS